LALVSNRNIAHDATKKALESEGSAMRENAAYMESYEARINLMKTAWQEFSLVMGDAVIGDSIIALTNLLTQLANVFSSVVKEFGLLPPLLGALGLLLGTVSKNFRVATISVLTFGNGLKALGVSATMAKTAIRSLLASTGIGLAFVALGFALEELIGLFAKGNEVQDDFFTELNTNIQDTKSQVTSLTEVIEKIEDHTTSQEELITTYKELSANIPSVISHYDAEGKAVFRNKEEILELVKAEKALLATKLKSQQLDLYSNFDTEIQKMEDAINKREELSESLNRNIASQEAYELIKQFGDSTNVFGWDTNYESNIKELKRQLKEMFELRGLSGSETEKYILSNLRSFYNGIDSTIEYVKDSRVKLEAEIANLNVSIDGGKESFKNMLLGFGELEYLENEFDNKNIQALFNSIATEIVESTKITPENYTEVTDNYRNYLNQISELVSSNKIDITKMIETNDFSELYKIIPELEGLIKKFSLNGQRYLSGLGGKFQVFDEAGNWLGEFSSAMEASEKGIQIFEDSLEDTEDGVIKFTGAIKDSAADIEAFQKSIDDTMSSINTLSSAYTTLADGQSLSHDTMLDLINKYPTLAKYLAETGDLTFKNGEMLKDVAEVERKIRAEEVRLALESVEAKKNELESKQNLVRQYYENYLKAGYSIDNWMIGSGLTKEEKEELNKKTQEYNTLLAQLKILEQPLDFKSSKKSSSSSSSAKDDPKLLDATDARINNINKEADALSKKNDELEKSINNELSLADQIKRNNELYSSRIREIEELSKANNNLLSEREAFVKKSGYSLGEMASWVDANGEATERYIQLYNNKKTGKEQEALEVLFNTYLKYTLAIRENRAAIIDLKYENEDLLRTIRELREENTRNWINKNNESYRKFEDDIVAAERIQMRYLKEGSDEWFKNQQKQIDLRKKWQNALHADNESYRQRIELNKTAREEDKLTEQQLKDLEDQIKANSDAWWNLESSIKATTESMIRQREENTRNWLNKNTEAYNEFENAITASQRAQMRYHEEGTEGWYKEQQKQVDTYKQWQEALHRDNEIYRDLIKNNDKLREEERLTEQELKDIQAQIDANSNSWWDLETAIKSVTQSVQDQREKYADNVIANYKKLLQEQQKLTEESYKKQIELEKKRHDERMKNLDEEYDEFEKLINAQMDALERNIESEDYEEQLAKLLEERAKIDNQIAVLALDDSFEAKAKRKALEEELALKDEEIVKFQRDRERELRKQGLQDQLDDRKETIDAEKKLEDEKHNKVIEGLESLIEANDKYYEGLLSDEQYFYQMKQDLMSDDLIKINNHLTEINKAYERFYKDLSENAKIYGDKISSNLLYSLKEDQTYANNVIIPKPESESKSAKQIAWEEYLENKRKAEAMGGNKGEEFNKLKARNDQLRAAWGFTDGSYAQLKDVKVYHKGGEVGTEGTSTEAWWKKLLKSNEIPAILREKEVVLDNPLNFLNGLASNVKNNLARMFENISNNNSTQSVPVINNYSVNIDKVIGDEKGARQAADVMTQALKNMSRTGRRV